MALNDDQEFSSLSRVMQALMLLTPEQQRRVLAYAVARFGEPGVQGVSLPRQETQS